MCIFACSFVIFMTKILERWPFQNLTLICIGDSHVISMQLERNKWKYSSM